MDDSSPLAMQFKELDTDGDNKLTVDQVHELLKLLGKNIYKGSITSAAKLLNYNQEGGSNLFTFSQFKQFFQAIGNPMRHDLWKAKYKILRNIKTTRDQTFGKQDTSTAAPGASAPGPKQYAQQTPFKGDIQLTVGPTDQIYNSFIHVALEKTPKPESKPFVKIVFEQSSNQKAKHLEEKFKKFQTSFFDLMRSSDPESAQILDYIHIITNVADTKLNVFVTISSEILTELGSLAADYLDRILGQKLQARVQFKHSFSVDIQKFIDKASDYTFYHALTKNYHTRLQWQALNFKQSAKQVLKILDAFSQLKYDKMDPFSIFLIGILHTDLCQAKFVFDNADIGATQLDSKSEILKQLGEAYVKVQEEAGDLGIFQLVNSFQNKIYVQACIGDWKANATVQIKDLKQLFSNKIAPEQSQQHISPSNKVPFPQQVYQEGLTKQVKIQLKDLKQSDEGSLKSQDSQSSMKKAKIPSTEKQEKAKVSVTPPKNQKKQFSGSSSGDQE